MCNIIVFASGRGSNLQALWKASQKPDSLFRIIAVISDNPDSVALEFAASKNIPAYCPTIDKNRQEQAWLDLLQKYNPDLICLAGFMKILSPKFISAWRNKIINIHPSLLPKYKGLDTHERALQAGDKQHGATVHHVTEKLDSGKIIKQTTIKVKPDDTPDSLAKRLLPREHKLYVDVVEKFAKDDDEGLKFSNKPKAFNSMEHAHV